MTTPNRPPLWREMHDAWDTAPPAPADADDDWTYRHGYAAEIRAVADWLIPDDPIPDVVMESDLDAFGIYMVFNRMRMHLRQQLLTEADRAERGEVEQ